MLRFLDNMRTLIMIKKSGFTLAEVLTTLMVIGVVAAMTIPTLMNSTNDQQLKVAYKKALSVLGQGVQLMTAKEEQCKVSTSSELATCFAQKVISGSVNGSVVTTSDGMQYAFIYKGGSSSENRTLEEICGDIGEAEGSGFKIHYNGENGNCAVMVDVNGKTKGTKGFNSDFSSVNINALDQHSNSDQFPILITGTGVRPMYYASPSVSGLTGYNGNKGWEYMYGDATP